jgi:hypothetical protein
MGCDVNSEAFLMTDFVNLKIKSTQSFRDTHRDRYDAYIHRSIYIYINIYIYVVLKKRMTSEPSGSQEAWVPAGAD